MSKKIIVLSLIIFPVLLFATILEKKSVLDKYLYLQNTLSFQAQVTKFIDGDSFEIKRIDTGTPYEIRMLGINTPEQSYPEPYATKATDFTKNALEGKTFTVYYAKDTYYQRDRYDRLLGVIYYNGRILNIDLLRQGLAKRFFYDENPIMNFEEWVKAEASARKRRLNIWSDYHKNRIVITEVYPDPPGNETGTGKEFLEIKNFGTKAINLKGWQFMFDTSTGYDKLTSVDFILNPGEICVISTISESDFRALFPSMPQNAKYLQSENDFWFSNNPTPLEQRIFYLVTPDKHIEDVLTFNLDWYDGVRNGGKSLQRVNFRQLESGIMTTDSKDKELFKGDTPTPGTI